MVGYGTAPAAGSGAWASWTRAASRATWKAVITSGASGWGGHLAIPLTEEQVTSGRAELRIELPAGARLPEQKGTLALMVALRDADGHVSSARPAVVSYGVGMQGGLQVALQWDTSTDVDLHVIGPSDTEIFWDTRSDSNGGSLDLDSNPGCVLDNVNRENVFWTRPARDRKSVV